MTLPPLDLASPYPEARMDAWRGEVEKALKGAPFARLETPTANGFALKPLYGPADLPPALARAERLSSRQSFEVRQLFEAAEPDMANREMRGELMRGVTALWLSLDEAARSGDFSRAAGHGGLIVRARSDLEAALDGIDLAAAPVALSAGASALPVAAWLTQIAAAKGQSGTARLFLGLDVFSALAAHGRIAGGLDAAVAEGAAFARRTSEALPASRAIGIDTRPYHLGGASDALEIAIALASGVAYLRALTKAGLVIGAAARQIAFTLTVDADYYLAIAKLRAARLLWARALEASHAAADERGAFLHAVTSPRMMARRDPAVNILRAGCAAFAAALGGADAITVLPFTAREGAPLETARRIARNTQVLLLEESRIAQTADPAAGAYAFEALTAALAASAWGEFQAIEAGGGIGAALAGGRLRERIARQWAERRAAIAKRRTVLTGVSEFANLSEKVPEAARPRVDATVPAGPELAAALAAVRQEVAPLQAHTDDEDFEALRAAAEAHAARGGARPEVALVPIGREADFSARVNFAKSFFEAGGIAARLVPAAAPADAAAAFLDTGARLAILCSSDALYAEQAGAYAKAVKEAGCRFLYLAGRPGDHERALREAGIDDFLFAGQDAVEALTRAHRTLGV